MFLLQYKKRLFLILKVNLPSLTGTFIGTFTIRDMASLQAQSGSNEIF